MIKVEGIYKYFKRYQKPSDRLKEVFFRQRCHSVYRVLNDINFSVASGETLGILGKNGAGKSTLLKIITGVLLADEGRVTVSGKITALLELGTGFDPQLSGLQNINTNGLLIGMNDEEIKACQQDIIEFSELADFINEPVRTYSSGMVMRLAFSIAMHASPSCFVVDEALSVGDAHFQQKCMRKIKEFRSQGGSIIFVSHDLNAVKMLCDRVIVLDEGIIVAHGLPEDAVNYYNQIIADLDKVIKPHLEGYGNKQAEITQVRLLGEDSHASVVSAGEILNITVCFAINKKIEDFTIGVLFRDRFGQDVFGTNSHHLGTEFLPHRGNHYQAEFSVKMELAPGKYTLTIALHSKENHIESCYHWQDNIETFEVAGIRGDNFSGVCRLPANLLFKSIENRA